MEMRREVRDIGFFAADVFCDFEWGVPIFEYGRIVFDHGQKFFGGDLFHRKGSGLGWDSLRNFWNVALRLISVANFSGSIVISL
jgi:hypothetical protein